MRPSPAAAASRSYIGGARGQERRGSSADRREHLVEIEARQQHQGRPMLIENVRHRVSP